MQLNFDLSEILVSFGKGRVIKFQLNYFTCKDDQLFLMLDNILCIEQAVPKSWLEYTTDELTSEKLIK